MENRLSIPSTDPVRASSELFNAGFGSKILVAASTRFQVFRRLAAGPLPYERLRQELALAERPMSVFITAAQIVPGLSRRMAGAGRLRLTELARTHLVPGGEFDCSDYLELATDAPGVKDLIVRMETDSQKGDDPGGEGAAYVADGKKKSAMENAELAVFFTECLAGRAKNTAALLTELVPLPGAKKIVDIGGGTGIFTAAFLQKIPGTEGR